MPSSAIRSELETFIRARYPVLYIVSSEEKRVLDMIRDIGKTRSKKVFEWSISTGIAPAGTSIQSAKTRGQSTRDPIAALDHVIDQVEPAIFVFNDLHPFLSRANFAVIRKLKEISLHLKHSYKTLILVSATLELPPELEKEVTVLTMPLPGPDELGILLDEIIAELREYKNLRIEVASAAREKILRAAQGLTISEAENVFARIIVRDGQLSGDDASEVLLEKRQVIRKSGLLEYCDTRETLESVGGLDLLKSWVGRRSRAFSQEALAFGLPAPKGILLMGVQGCGKSLCAKAVARHWQMPLLRFDMGRMFSGLVGSSEENVRRAIAVAESVSPAVLWVDEIDKAFAGSQGSAYSDGGTAARVFATLLTWLSEKTAPLFVVATANDISQLPPELLRKGRLDEMFFVDLPNSVEREEIFAIQLRKYAREPAAFALKDLASRSTDLSGAEIEQVIISGLYEAFSQNVELGDEHLFLAAKECVPLAKTMSESIAAARLWAQGRARPASSKNHALPPSGSAPLRPPAAEPRHL